MTECVFALSGTGENREGIHYYFADLLTAEMMLGTRLDDRTVVTQMFEKTLEIYRLSALCLQRALSLASH